MIDLHTHTDESDGSLSPEELVAAASRVGIGVLAITDHDTLAGYDKALPAALHASVRLIRGIELNTRHDGRSVHLLAYFVTHDPGAAFRVWLQDIVSARRARNHHLVERLRELGVDIRLEEVEALGRTLTGRPHFARILVAKGYAANRDEAFSKYLGETGIAFVERDAPDLAETIRLVTEAGGITSLAHPIRLLPYNPDAQERLIAGLAADGLHAIEAYHSDHTAEDAARFVRLAERYELGITGGSDFHGSYKPGAQLGYGADGAIPVPDSVLSGIEPRNGTTT